MINKFKNLPKPKYTPGQRVLYEIKTKVLGVTLEKMEIFFITGARYERLDEGACWTYTLHRVLFDDKTAVPMAFQHEIFDIAEETDGVGHE